jgi:hypothetical protein
MRLLRGLWNAFTYLEYLGYKDLRRMVRQHWGPRDVVYTHISIGIAVVCFVVALILIGISASVSLA